MALFALEKNLRKSILETGDKVSLDLYVKFKSAQRWFVYQQYARIFGLCRFLNVNNLYDIGCGFECQAFLLANHSHMTYVGIDCGNKIDFNHINELFANYNGKIKFQKRKYPFTIMPAKNNIAIACGWLGKYDETKKKITSSLSIDFERIFINLLGDESFETCYEVWAAELSDFKLHKIGYNRFIFGTKHPEEIFMLKTVEYNFLDDRFAIENVDSCEFVDMMQHFGK